VARHECINLLAPEALMSPTVRSLLSAEVGQRAAEGHIGPVNRWFAGTKHIDEIESLCVELLKRLFKSNYAEHRLGREHDRQHGRLRRADRARRHGDDDPAAGRRPSAPTATTARPASAA
jgi:hypothetical protein